MSFITGFLLANVRSKSLLVGRFPGSFQSIVARVSDEEWHILKPPVIACLDEEKTKFSTPKLLTVRGSIKAPFFKQEAIVNCPVFCPSGYDSIVYCSDAFRDFVTDAGLTGLDFDPVGG